MWMAKQKKPYFKKPIFTDILNVFIKIPKFSKFAIILSYDLYHI